MVYWYARKWQYHLQEMTAFEWVACTQRMEYRAQQAYPSINAVSKYRITGDLIVELQQGFRRAATLNERPNNCIHAL